MDYADDSNFGWKQLKNRLEEMNLQQQKSIKPIYGIYWLYEFLRHKSLRNIFGCVDYYLHQ